MIVYKTRKVKARLRAIVYPLEPRSLVMYHKRTARENLLVRRMEFSMGMIHGGWLVAKVLKREGVEVVFTLSGGHIAAIYDGCIREGIRVVDTRHEQAAVHAAEGWAKCTRTPGVAILTAGPNVNHGIKIVKKQDPSENPFLFNWGAT